MNTSERHPNRRGAAFLAIVVVLLLVVLAATKGMVQNEIANRRGNSQRQTTQLLANAIASTQSISDDELSRLRLPVATASTLNTKADETASHWIKFDVQTEDSKTTYQAVLTRGENELERMTFERNESSQ